MPQSVAPIAEGDLEAIVAMAQDLSIHEGMPPAEITPEGLSRVMFGPGPLLFGRVARSGTATVGYALWTIGFDVQYGKSILEIVDLYVKPEFRRQGFARMLMRTMAQIAQEQGHRFLLVKSFKDNAEANAFYESCGGELDHTNVYGFGISAMSALAVSKT